MQNYNVVKETIEEFFKKASFQIVFDSFLEEAQTIFVNIKADNPQILIGENGQSLIETEYLLRLILKKKIKTFFYFDFDIDNYKKKKREHLKKLADSVAAEVVLSQKDKELAPMPAYDRRIIHLALSERKDVMTESVGEGLERRVKIKLRL